MSTDEYKNDLSGYLDSVARQLEKAYGLLFKVRPSDAAPGPDDGLAEVVCATLDALAAGSGALTAIAERLAALDDREDASDEDELDGCEASEAASSDFDDRKKMADFHARKRERPSLLRDYENPFPQYPGSVRRSQATATTPPEAVEASAELPTSACDAWLRRTLAHGSVPAAEVISSGLAAGFSKDQVERAKKRVGARSVRIRFGPKSRCVWVLDSEPKQA